MISSWVWHSRSAQRRPWRSFSSSSSARARAWFSAVLRRSATALRNSRSRPAWIAASALRSATMAVGSINSMGRRADRWLSNIMITP